jgi:hypothetical protein
MIRASETFGIRRIGRELPVTPTLPSGRPSNIAPSGFRRAKNPVRPAQSLATISAGSFRRESRMMKIDSFLPPNARSLDPDDLRIAADAFEAALPALDESIPDPYAARQSLARFVIDRAFQGERSPDRLRSEALDHVKAIRRRAVA